jgi:hypothetical protein
MKRALASAALLALFASPAAALTLWQGDVFVTAISETNPGTSCKKVNVAIGDFFRSVFRPKGLTDNGNDDLLSFIGSDSAIQLVPTTPAGGTLNGATAGTARTIYGSAVFRQVTNVAFSRTTVTPAAPLADTPTVRIEITIKDVFSENAVTPSGCDATYTGSLAAVASDNLLGTWVANAGSLANASGIQTFTEDTSGNIHYLGNTNIPMSTPEEFTLSVKVRSKPGQAARNLIFEVFLTGTSEHIAGIVSLSDGAGIFTAASAGFVATSITTTPVGDGWWLMDVVFSAPVPPNNAINAFFLLAHPTGAESYIGDGAAGIQFENASLTVNAP